MKANVLLGIEIVPHTRKIILEKIKKYIRQPAEFFPIVSLNPENMVVASEDELFKKAVSKAQISIVDGAGVVWAGHILGIEVGERVTGVSLMKDMLMMANELRLRVLLIGGQPNLALQLAKCYTKVYAQARFSGVEGIKNIHKPQLSEEKELLSIVSTFKPHFVFVSFGSPEQELWLYRHKDIFTGIVCMGVGGAFAYEAGRVLRAPGILQTFGLEWLFRLIVQPWRWRRQVRLLKFIWLVLREKITKSVSVHPAGG